MATTRGTSKKNAAAKAAGGKGASKRSGKGKEKRAGSAGSQRVSKPRRDAVPRNSTVYMTSTEAQNGFGRVLDLVALEDMVLITKRNTPQAIVMSVKRYEALTRETSPGLDELTAEFDTLLERMQTPEARAGLRDAFRASPEELSRAAVATAEMERRGEKNG